MSRAFDEELMDVTCPTCSACYRVPKRKRGKKSRCKRCKKSFLVLSDLDVNRNAQANQHVQVACPFCQHRYVAKRRKLGKAMSCRGCDKMFRLFPAGAKGLSDPELNPLQVDAQSARADDHTSHRTRIGMSIDRTDDIDAQTQSRPGPELGSDPLAKPIPDTIPERFDARQGGPPRGIDPDHQHTQNDPDQQIKDGQESPSDERPPRSTDPVEPNPLRHNTHSDPLPAGEDCGQPDPQTYSSTDGQPNHGVPTDDVHAATDTNDFDGEAEPAKPGGENESIATSQAFDLCDLEQGEPEEIIKAHPATSDDVTTSQDTGSEQEKADNGDSALLFTPPDLELDTSEQTDEDRPTAPMKPAPDVPVPLETTARSHAGKTDTSAVDTSVEQLVTAQPAASLGGFPAPVTATAMSTDGAYFAAADSTGELRLWALRTQDLLFAKQILHGPIWAMSFVKQNHQLCVGGSDGQVHCINAIQANSGPVSQFQAHKSAITALAAGSLGGTPVLLTAAKEPVAALWNLETGLTMKRFAGHRDRISAVALSPDAKTAVTTSWDGTARVWNVQDGEQIEVMDRLGQRPICLAIDWASQTAWVGWQDGVASRWLWVTSEEPDHISLDERAITSIALSADSPQRAFCFTAGKRLIPLHHASTDHDRQATDVDISVSQSVFCSESHMIYASGYRNEVLRLQV